MPSKKLRRTTYRDPFAPGNPTRMTPIETQHIESVVDQELLIVPAQMVHASSLHDWGVHEGFEVRAKTTTPGVRVFAGVASDVDGNHISMVVGGIAELGPPWINPAVQPPPPPIPNPSTLIAVTTNGVNLKTTGLQGAYYVTVGFWETFDDAAWNQSMQTVYYMDHSPWLLLEKVANFTNDGKRVVLAQVDFPTDGTTGAVMGLTPGIRRQGGIHAQRIRLRKPRLTTTAQDATVDDTAYGDVRPLADGISVSVPHASDQIVFGADDGHFRRMVVHAEEIVAISNSGGETVKIESNKGNVVAGGNGAEGDVVVLSDDDKLMVVLDADGAQVVVGGDQRAGNVVVLDGAKGPTVQLVGQGGDVRFQSRLRDMTNSYPGVSHSMLKDLTDGGLTTLHRHLTGNAARPIRTAFMFVPFPPAPVDTSVTVSLGATLQCFAYVVPIFFRPVFAPSFWCDIPATSNGAQPAFLTGPVFGGGSPSFCARPFFSGTASAITFRMACPGTTEGAAYGVVFAES